MQDYSFNEVNDAKRRVQEMKTRAREKAGEEGRADYTRLVLSLRTKKEKAFALSLIYILNNDSVSEDMLLFIFNILFN